MCGKNGQQARGLIYHATGTSYELDAARVEESAAMACSEQARGVINLLMGTSDLTHVSWA